MSPLRYLDRQILHLPELDNFDCSGRGHMAAPPSSLARRRIFGQALRPSLRAVSPSRLKISLTMWRVRRCGDRALDANSAVSALRMTISFCNPMHGVQPLLRRGRGESRMGPGTDFALPTP